MLLFVSFITETTKPVQHLKVVLHNLTVRLQWKAPDVFISEVDGYKISYMWDPILIVSVLTRSFLCNHHFLGP